MRRLSDALPRAARRRFGWAILVVGFVASPQPMYGQYRKWSVAAAIGYNQFNLDAVDEKNEADVQGWAKLGYLVGPLASVKQAPSVSAGIAYRFDRDFGFSFAASYWSKTVSSSYNSSGAMLQLERGVGSTDMVLGISYYPSARPYFLEWYLQANFGICLARATAKAVGWQMVKTGSMLVPELFVDTDATFTKSKATVGILAGADMPLAGGLSLKAEAGYRFAQFGTMEGDVTQLGQHSTQTSTITFDYSGFQVSAGLRFQF